MPLYKRPPLINSFIKDKGFKTSPFYKMQKIFTRQGVKTGIRQPAVKRE